MIIDLASLIEWALRSSLFLVGVLLLIKCMGHRISASLRHVFLVVGMFGAAAMPLLSVVLPDWGVIPATLLEGKNGTPPVGLVETSGIAVPPDTSIGESSWVEIVFLVWVLVSIFLMFRVLIAMYRVRTVANGTNEIVEKERIYQVLNGLRSRLRINTSVLLSLGPSDTSPKTVGGIFPKIILPEGSKVGKFHSPYPTERQGDDLHYTYLDTSGRPVITIRNIGDLTEKHIQDFQLEFKFAKTSMINEPLLLIVAFFLFFFMSIVYVRLDFAIARDESAESKLKVAGVCEKIANLQVNEKYLKKYLKKI